MPYVARDLMQFPVATLADGYLDLVIQEPVSITHYSSENCLSIYRQAVHFLSNRLPGRQKAGHFGSKP